MISQTHIETEAEGHDHATAKHTSKAQSVLNFAALGCLLAGAVGILRALEMERAGDGLLCLLGSLAACGLVCYLYFHKD